MGGRGSKKKPRNEDRWDWIKDVPDNRLKNYVKRSSYLNDRPDPTGRSIHDVAFWAQKELDRRGK